MIPRILHFIWTGPPMPEWAQDNVRLFRELNPDFLVHVHDESILLPCLEPAYRNVTGDHIGSRRSDLLRISALVQHGGWYLDCDFLPLRPLSDVYRDHGDFPRDCFVTQGDWVPDRHVVAGAAERTRKWIANGVIATTADSPFLACTLRGVLMADVKGLRWWGSTATFLFTELVERYPGIVHVDRMDNWYRVQPRELSKQVCRTIRDAGFSRAAIEKHIGVPLPYAMHIGMQDELEI